jgi:hypothetical protein
MEIKTHDDFKNVVHQILKCAYDFIPPSNPSIILLACQNLETGEIWSAYEHTNNITKEFGMLMAADILLGLNYNFGDLDTSGVKKIFDKQISSFGERVGAFNSHPSLRYFIRTLADKNTFVQITNLHENDYKKFLELFRVKITKTGG